MLILTDCLKAKYTRKYKKKFFATGIKAIINRVTY